MRAIQLGGQHGKDHRPVPIVPHFSYVNTSLKNVKFNLKSVYMNLAHRNIKQFKNPNLTE